MKNFNLALVALTALGGVALAAGSASAAPMSVNGLQSESGVTQVRMMHGDRMMMKKRMMRKQMMKRRMMKKRMMNRGM
ncbi:hypothetical protein QO001_003050 [Methylobacterium brachiatum]|jgi:hypothetical protein|uniref:Pentapeptide MXKDX repeat protein n=1 Tax=Methylobacterium brachiatum TaxID=269660 RepID=A0AAJ1TNW6_9HYPH|nr:MULTISPECIES: hypothetical protein [Methylobacterium]MCB4803389.1 hypothetical protein [Methylobacterium brachiatum]MCJ2086438.1 hypothetical protein [Methylobacterium sp. E-005]MDQ0544121.1 hypothetical protein [Methylobacterium brachiatum]